MGFEHFIIVVDLATFGVRSNPKVRAVGHLFGAVSGHLSGSGANDRDRPAIDRFVAAYVRDGPELSARLLGQYAGVIVDRAQRSVCLVQDSLGLRQLFYAHLGDELVVGSNLEYVVAYAGIGRLDERYFGAQFATGVRPRGTTPYAAISRLDFGTTLVITRFRRDESQPWRPPSGPARKMALADAAPHLRHLVDEAVQSALPPHGRVLCELSGGLDSTTVLSTAVKFDPAVQALSITRSSHTAGDDDRYSREAAAVLGIRRHAIDADRFPHFSALADRFAAEPGGESHVAVNRAYDEVLVDEAIDVVLTGDPGDVVFGYGGLAPAHLADPLFRFRPLAAVRAARAWAAHADVDRPWTHLFVHHALDGAWRHRQGRSLVGDAHAAIPDWVSPGLLQRTGVTAATGAQAAPRVSAPGQQYLWESIYGIAAQVTDCTRLSAPAEVRHPLFHRPLVEFMIGLDSDLRHGAAGDRVLQRHALADRLPSSVRTRTTKGSSQQARERALVANETWYRSLTANPRLVDRGWVEPRLWRQQIDRVRLGLYGRRPNLDIAILTEFWLRTIEDYKPRALPPLHAADDAVGDR